MQRICVIIVLNKWNLLKNFKLKAQRSSSFLEEEDEFKMRSLIYVTLIIGFEGVCDGIRTKISKTSAIFTMSRKRNDLLIYYCLT